MKRKILEDADQTKVDFATSMPGPASTTRERRVRVESIRPRLMNHCTPTSYCAPSGAYSLQPCCLWAFRPSAVHHTAISFLAASAPDAARTGACLAWPGRITRDPQVLAACGGRQPGPDDMIPACLLIPQAPGHQLGGTRSQLASSRRTAPSGAPWRQPVSLEPGNI